MRHLRALAVLSVLAALGPAPALAQDDAKFDACEKAPTHACVLDLLWDQMPRVGRDYEAETKRAFIDAALLTGDKALIDLYLERTGWRGPDALNSSYISVARQKGDRATLVKHGDEAIRGLRYDWYQLSDIARGLAEVGEIEKARKVADLIPHGDDDSVTTLNLHTNVLEVISFHDATPITLRQWADRIAVGDGWWTDENLAWLKAAVTRTSDLNAFSAELQARYREDGWRYLRALVRLAPQMTASPDADRIFSAHVESWADPRNDDIAEVVLAIAARSSEDVRAAILQAFDTRQPSPPPGVARIRALMANLDAPMANADKAALGLIGGSYEQKRAARLLATLSPKDFITQARAGEDDFSLSRPAVLRAALAQTDDKAFARDIALLMAELGEPRTIDGYDYAQYATEWARDACDADVFNLAESRLARRDFMDTMMWRARFDGDPVSIVRFVSFDDRISSEVSYALRGYEAIIAKGYCTAR
jgi:hypothetical protein